VIRTFAFPVALFGVVACAAVLGIDERSAIDNGPLAEGGTDAPRPDVDLDAAASDDAELDVDTSINPGFVRQCDPTACKDNACTFACEGKKCPGPLITCPANNDCQIECTATSCTQAKCTGGLSCTFNCPFKDSCKDGIVCESGRCEFFCTGDSCQGMKPKCKAEVCIGHCSGPNACKNGLDFTASKYCGITCSGKASCSADKAAVQCTAPDASIDCTSDNGDTCKDSRPTCFVPDAGTCAIRCANKESCAKHKVCCDGGGACVIDPFRENDCKPL
jgi:hypothetical protein